MALPSLVISPRLERVFSRAEGTREREREDGERKEEREKKYTVDEGKNCEKALRVDAIIVRERRYILGSDFPYLLSVSVT